MAQAEAYYSRRQDPLGCEGLKELLQAMGPNGCPPVLLAAQHGHTSAVATLLDLGAEPDCQEPASGWTPLMFAVAAGNTSMVQALLAHGASVNKFVMPQDSNALSVAILSNQDEIIGMLLDAGGDLRILKRRHPCLADTYTSALVEHQANRKIKMNFKSCWFQYC